jgi:hydrogenase maturation protease
MKTIVIGLGNPILTDDGVGVLVAYQVANHLATKKPIPDVKVTEASVGGLRLMELMNGYDRAILIDALKLKNDNNPGRIHRMTLDDLKLISPTQHSASAHDTSLVTALEAGQLLGMYMPDEIIIFAIEVENIIDFSDQPTQLVAEAIPSVTTAVLNELSL